MCLCERQPVFTYAGYAEEPLLEDLFGRDGADYLRALVGADTHWDQPTPYGLDCTCTDSFLTASLSLWALLVILISFAAGLLTLARRKAGWWMLAVGAAVSIADFGFRLQRMLDTAVGEKRDLTLDYWPAQLAFNLTFHMAVPFALGAALALLAAAIALGPRALLRRSSPSAQ